MRTLASFIAITTFFSLGVALTTATPADAGPPASGETHVSTYTALDQYNPSVASDAAGDSIVVWASDGQDGSGDGIYAQRYGSDGTADGSEFRVSLTTTGDQYAPDVAMNSIGDVVVTWTSVGQDGSGRGVYARRFPSNSRTPGPEARVNVTTANEQFDPHVAIDAAGGYAITWTSGPDIFTGSEVYSRRYTPGGAPVTSEMVVNDTTTGTQYDSDIAMDAAGNYAITWTSSNGGYDVLAARYNPAGTKTSSEFVVNPDDGVVDFEPSVAMAADGDYIVSWTSDDADAGGISAQRFTGINHPLGAELRVNTATGGPQSGSSVATDANGDFAVTWITDDADQYGVSTQRYTSTGARSGGETHVNLTTSGVQWSASTALDADGDGIVAWSSNGQDGSGFGIYARRFRGPDPVDLRLTQTDDTDPLPVSGRVTYRLKVANLEEPSTETGVPSIDGMIGAATGVSVVSTIPDGATYISSAGAGWICTPGAAAVRCAFGGVIAAGKVAPRLSVSYDLSDEAGAVEHEARVFENQLDAVATNNGDVETTRALCFLQVGSTAVSSAESGVATVPVNRVGTGCGTTGVSYDTADGTARADSDYDATSGVLVLDEATSTRSIDVPVMADVLDERNETFGVRLTDPSGALLGPSSRSTVTITDDDAPPRINFTTATGTGAEPGALFDVTVRLSAVSGVPVTVTLAKSGTATSGADYFAPTKITIPPGQRSADFTIEVADDASAEGDETAVLTLAAPVNVVLGSLKTYQLTITSNE